MVYWAFISFAVALMAGLFGFGGQATPVAGLAQTLFFVFLGVAAALVGVRAANDFNSDNSSSRD
ncbi:DUF1328 domain-containing protein [Palleronia abyssalis]|uniref:UPF0391 membrane protein PAA8504_00916 n=1 Tax=Palleronia abyssalis TaxID=1501240 RepID=A0A2R8BSJ6_9RHOB|nr:DUF1328 family protein [Palleronia abyssalis]SPJ23111.1 hypothetical protein PAA8504_00916 [Palleronia abyssalis]